MIINSVFFNKFLNNNAVRKSINIIIYTVLLAQGNALAASSGSVSQTFSDKWSGLPTVRDMGAKMAGAVTDEMAIQQAFDMAPGSTGVINVPSGIWPAVNGSIFSPVKRDINKTVLWNFLGPVVSAGRPVGGVGSGDVTETYISNSKNFWRRWDSATSDAPIVRIALDNYAGNWHTDFQGPGTPWLSASLLFHIRDQTGIRLQNALTFTVLARLTDRLWIRSSHSVSKKEGRTVHGYCLGRLRM